MTSKSVKPAAASKRDTLLKMLRGNKGASIEEMQKVTGWQPHSVRGFMSGVVKKKLLLTVNSHTSKSGIRRYSIAAS